MSSANPQGLQAFPDELADRESWLNPFEWYRQMRDDAPVRYDASRGSWDVFRYDDVKRILDDDETFSVDPERANDFVEPENEGEGLILQTMLFEDPPRHDELRGVVEEPFRPRAIRQLEPRIRELTTEILDDVLDDADGKMDIVGDLAYPLPVMVIAELLGVPAEKRDQFKTWSDTLIESAADDVDTQAYMEEQRQVQMEMAWYFLELIEERRENPRDDLISTIVTTELGDGSHLSREEALGTCILLLVAGNITTTNLVTNAVRCFDEADQFDAVRGDDRALTTAIEEVLRYRSPVQAMTRVATRDVDVQDATIGEGDRIVVWLGSGNRDERKFDDADRFVPDRAPNQHLGFGHGTHYCLGAPLARLEAKVVFSELLDRVKNVRVADTELSPLRSSFIYGVESLPVTFDKR
ncbi:cytochrome [Haloprofundus marisrubri]|uniref:Cytochrome n=1 Tax=Haloprofundus marisrubri TaxID=1514971 RepID=A0A0W1R320_9EURY|nr:cytochrome P450 [Haloprofundus marisrubri]KTG07617.1 cytochrome [Haloprofundus marisrubri]